MLPALQINIESCANNVFGQNIETQITNKVIRFFKKTKNDFAGNIDW